MFKIFAILYFFIVTFGSADERVMQKLSPQETLKVLEGLKDKAIVFGEGESEIHTFIDPYCELSQRYLSFIFAQQERMFKKYKFYFYLYELPGKNSSQVIEQILSLELKDVALKSVMLQHQQLCETGEGDSQEAINSISGAAQTIGVFKRPYIIINGKVK